MGVPLDVGFAVAAVGIFLGAIALSMLGPLFALRATRGHPMKRVWFLLIPTRGKAGLALEIPLSVGSLAWVVAPGAVLWTQLATSLPLSGVNTLALRFSELGLAFAVAVFAWAAIQLFLIRRGYSEYA